MFSFYYNGKWLLRIQLIPKNCENRLNFSEIYAVNIQNKNVQCMEEVEIVVHGHEIMEVPDLDEPRNWNGSACRGS